MPLRKLESFWFSPSDRRVYSLVQFFYAFAALCNILQLFPDRYYLLSDEGLFSNSSRIFDKTISVFRLFDSGLAVDVLFALAVVTCFALMVNLLPRPAAILLFLWHLSLMTRLGPATSGWDYLLTSLGFQVMISPMREKSVPCYGLRLTQLQVAVLYWGALLHRLDSPSWLNGGEVAYFLNSEFSLFPTRVGIEHPMVSQILTYLTLAIEVFLPILLWNKRTRLLAFILGYTLHGILLLTHIPVFAVTVMTAYLAFLTGEDLDRLPLNRLAAKIEEMSRGFRRRFANHF